MKKLFLILLIVLSLFLVSCERGYKVRNSSMKVDGRMIYKSATGNKYFYRQAIFKPTKKDYDGIRYQSTNDEDIDILLKELPTRNYKQKTKEEYDRAYLEDQYVSYYFGLYYADKQNGTGEVIHYNISPTRIIVDCKMGEDHTYYILAIDEEFYNEFYKLECEYITTPL